MRRVAMIPAVILGLCFWLAPVASAPKPLQIYFIDVEGGQSTLIVDPQGESLLIDMSPKAAEQLDMKPAGIARVMVEQVVAVTAGAK